MTGTSVWTIQTGKTAPKISRCHRWLILLLESPIFDALHVEAMAIREVLCRSPAASQKTVHGWDNTGISKRLDLLLIHTLKTNPC